VAGKFVREQNIIKMKGIIAVVGIVVSLLAMSMIIRPEADTHAVNDVVEDNNANNMIVDIDGPELYRLNCAGCHGIERQGNPPTFPSLINVKDKKSKAEIVTQVKNGKGVMPPMTHLADAEINAIVSYLYNEEPKINENLIVEEMSVAQKGEMLFKSNCISCHRSITSDPLPQNSNTKVCGMMEPATLSGVPTWYNKDEFAQILDRGPCYMPSFSFMHQDDKDAVYDYLATLKDPGNPKRMGGGMMMMHKKKGKRKQGWMCY
jgi:mono/diheme cytochrome c family protein